MDSQRIRHPNAKKFSYASKALKMRSRIDFFLISKKMKSLVRKHEREIKERFDKLDKKNVIALISITWIKN